MALRRALAGTVAAGVLLAVACGEPAGPVPQGWVFRAAAPGGNDVRMAAAAGKVYLIPDSNSRDVYVYADGVVTLSYQAPEGVTLNAVSFAGAEGFVGGVRGRHPGDESFLARYAGGAWTEVELPADDVRSVKHIKAVDAGRCWLLAHTRDHGNQPALWDGATLTIFPQPQETYDCAYDAGTGAFYCWHDPSHTLYMTTDRGATWGCETLPTLFSSVHVDGIRGGDAAGGVLFLHGYDAVIRRDGPPGEGEYKLAFYSPHNAYFREISGVAFADASHGVAVGSLTSAVYVDGEWFQEVVPENIYFYAVTADAGASRERYWAFGNWGPLGWGLLSHD